MGSLWRDSIHGALYRDTGDDAPFDATRVTALLVGIDPQPAIALVRMLSPLARSRLAADVPQAIQMGQQLQPDLLILGGEVRGGVLMAPHAFNADAALVAVPALVLASRAGDASRISALHGGALGWLPHTTNADALLARVRAAIGARRHGRMSGGARPSA